MAYVTNPELNAMNDVLEKVKNLTDAQRARVFAWVDIAVAESNAEIAAVTASPADMKDAA
jgi:predicted P-loop ATPase/GTPase